MVGVFLFPDVICARERRLFVSFPFLPPYPCDGREKRPRLEYYAVGQPSRFSFVAIQVWRTLHPERLSSSWAFQRCTRVHVASVASTIHTYILPVVQLKILPKFGAEIGSQCNIRTDTRCYNQASWLRASAEVWRFVASLGYF